MWRGILFYYVNEQYCASNGKKLQKSRPMTYHDITSGSTMHLYEIQDNSKVRAMKVVADVSRKWKSEKDVRRCERWRQGRAERESIWNGSIWHKPYTAIPFPSFSPLYEFKYCTPSTAQQMMSIIIDIITIIITTIVIDIITIITIITITIIIIFSITIL